MTSTQQICLAPNYSHRKTQCAVWALAGSIAGMSGFVASNALAEDEYSPPANYYANVNGTGSLLKSQLTAAMSAGHIQRSYGDFRSSARFHDTDPNNPSNILLVYNLASVNGSWDSGSTWNREHVWPQSRQPGSASNGTRGNLGDPHALRPANPSINSSRGNKPFGNATSTGGFGSVGSLYFPGDTDKGDISRSLFYSATRYASSGLSLVHGTPGSNQMGDLGALMAWHFLDTPSTFERRRNHVIFSQALNPGYRTNNRNAYVDHPEYAWSVFMDQNNDTTLYFGDLEPANGASSIDLVYSVFQGDTINPINLTLNRAGSDGTYFSVEVSEGMSSTVTGCFNTFPMNMNGVTQPITLSFDSDLTDTAGSYLGELTVDNLDVTTQGGAGNGANDANDIVFVSIDVYTPSHASFSDSVDQNTITVDLGTINTGSGDGSESVQVFNLGSAANFGAPIDIELISSSGDTMALSTDFTNALAVNAEESAAVHITLDDATAGNFNASYILRVYHDQALFSDPTSIEDLTLHVAGIVGSGGCSIADLAEPYGQLNFFDVSAFLNMFNAQDPAADFNNDGDWNFFDVSEFLNAFSAGCP